MKKIITFLISVIILISLCGCNIKSLYEDLDNPSKVSNSIFGNLIKNNSDDIVSLSPTQISDEDLSYAFAYNELSDIQKNIYEICLNASEEMPTGFINLGKADDCSTSDIMIAYRALLYDNPQLFWMPNTYLIGNRNDGKKITVTIAFEYSDHENDYHYLFDKKTRDSMKEKLNDKVNAIVNNAEKLKTEYEKEKYFNDYISNNTTYTTDNAIGHTVYGCLVDGNALCEGYSRAFQLLCKKSGIRCFLVCGTSENEGHMWNCVNIAGDWSYVDVTWNDTEPGISYAFFNITEKQLLFDHELASLVSNTDTSDLSGEYSINYTIKECN